MVTSWHIEPGGRDALTVCADWREGRRSNAWKWHVHHWRIQVRPLQALRRWLLSRCAGCGRRFPYGYAPISNQWDSSTPGFLKGEQGIYHHECHRLDTLRRQRDENIELIRRLFELLRQSNEEPEAVTLARLTDPKDQTTLDFRLRRHLTHLLGYERDDAYQLRRIDRPWAAALDALNQTVAKP